MPFNATRGVGAAKGYGFTAGGGGLYPFTTFTFTNAEAQGTFGPTSGQCNAAYAGQPFLGGFFAVAPQGYQILTVPRTTTYRITAAGAQGGAGKWNTYYGGLGAIMRADFNLAAGSTLILVVGQRGGYVENSGQGSGGGGGGSFVFSNTVSSGGLLIAAGGGGGGGGNTSPVNGIFGATTTSGKASPPSGGSPGTGGNGGTASSGGGAGGGLLTAGSGTTANVAGNGASIITTAVGGRGGDCTASQSGSRNFNGLGQDQGGFGGGGGGEWCSAGAVGAGGGYSGGAGQPSSSGVGGGGGSFFSGVATNRATSNGFYEDSSSGIINLGQFNGTTSLGQFVNAFGYVTIQAL